MSPGADQTDTDSDGQGDACDTDDDGDGLSDSADPDCAAAWDDDESGTPTACENGVDDDGDGWTDDADPDCADGADEIHMMRTAERTIAAFRDHGTTKAATGGLPV